jgi:hypothetical protein
VQKYRRGKGMTLEASASKPALAADGAPSFRARVAHCGLQATYIAPPEAVGLRYGVDWG